jgi:hypothetical protein
MRHCRLVPRQPARQPRTPPGAPNPQSDIWQQATVGPSAPPKSLLIYISSYINDYGRPWTSADVNQGLGLSTDKLQVVARCCLRLQIKWLAARSLGRLSIHVVVPAAMAPSASRCDGASATIAPVTTTSTAARTRERGRSRVRLGKSTNKKSVPSACPTGGSTGVFHG